MNGKRRYLNKLYKNQSKTCLNGINRILLADVRNTFVCHKNLSFG